MPRKNDKRTVAGLVLGLALLTTVVTAGSVGGQSPDPEISPTQTPAITGKPGLKIVPPAYEEDLEAGQPKDGVINVYNTSSATVTVQPEIENVRMTGDDGTLEYYVGDNPFKLHRFVETDRTPFTLGVDEVKTVKFRVAIPTEVFPGGYFGAILFRIVPPDGPDRIGTNDRASTLLVFNVLGDVDRRGAVRRAELVDNVFSDQKRFRLTYANTGNTDRKPLGVAYRPQGTLIVKNLFGLTVKRQQIDGDVIFPGAQRTFQTSVKKPLLLGRYTAEFNLRPGHTGSSQTKTVVFWAVSPLAAIVSLIVLLAVGYAVRRVRKRFSPRTPNKASSLMDEAAKLDASQSEVTTTDKPDRPERR